MPDIFLSPDLLPYWVAAGVLVGLVAIGLLSMLTGAAFPIIDHSGDAGPHLLHGAADGASVHDASGSARGWPQDPWPSSRS